MKYNFSKIKILDIEGNEIPKSKEIFKTIANIIYTQSHEDLGLVEVAKEIYKGKEVEIDKIEIETIKKIIKWQISFTDAFIKKQVIDFIEQQK